MATILITGGAGGIGREVARQLAARGDVPVVADLDAAKAEETAAGIERASGIQLDVTDQQACREAVATVVDRHGGIDGAVCCAGVFHYESADELRAEHLDRMLRINVQGSFFTCQAVAQAMLDADRPGSMVLFSSGAANRAVGAPAYSASKAAVEALTRELSLAWAERGIRVNAIAPGVILTDMSLEARSDPETIEAFMRHTPMRRMGEPEEVAAAAVFLLSDAASYVTAAVLPTDGGFLSI
jgi:NAD(P)-dependent dehydrogenase (short-subunit alcohol dehydrogenase family)